MIINTAPQNEAIISNVGEIGEFRIRNSAKAFNILSSGLYANKIRAIIRELSCNAIDSHVAAGKRDTPFDIHLPNVLEPWFSIRDYGTGLSHQQVVNIYTTYFESTKTTSNEFIGALGLGSKSPFSYTDNFSVTAVKDGVKGIYTAFINEQGVPSIALMTSENTTDPNGVEVKFSVNDRYDFDKFRTESRNVYRYFKKRPVVSGATDFTFAEPEYIETDIIPGVHTINSHNSYAIMGNIAYPIQVPEADKTLGKLRGMLDCGLVMEFNIGELDFQASREGLSYVPMTIDSIKKKLEVLNAHLAIHIKQEADKISNMWERSYYLFDRSESKLWNAAVSEYVTDTNFGMFKSSFGGRHSFSLDADTLQKDYNIVIRQFSKSAYNIACENKKPRTRTISMSPYLTETIWDVTVLPNMHFVINDTKLGATERAKYHYRADKKHLLGHGSVSVTVIEPADRTKPVKLKEFFTSINNPPENQIFKASDLSKKERASGMGKNVTILQLEKRERGWRNVNYVWTDAGKADSFDKTQTYYYLPLSGYQSLGIYSDVKDLRDTLTTSGLYDGIIYGVRKGDIEYIKTQSNWVNIDTMVLEKLGKLDMNYVIGMAKEAIDFKAKFKYDVKKLVMDKNSPYLKFVAQFEGIKSVHKKTQVSLEKLCRMYQIRVQQVDATSVIDKFRKEANDILDRYPLLQYLSYSTSNIHVAEYINAIDITKGI